MLVCGHERILRLSEVLARNRQSALERFRCTIRARAQPPRMFTIPPRQRLSSTTRLAIRARDVVPIIKTHTHKELVTINLRERDTHTTRTLKFISLSPLSRVFSKRFFFFALSIPLSLDRQRSDFRSHRRRDKIQYSPNYHRALLKSAHTIS